MNSIAFWKSWGKSYQYLLGFFFAILLAAIIYFWFAYLTNPSPVISWDQFQQLNSEEVQIRTFNKSIFEIPVYSNNFVIYEILAGSELQPNTLTPYLFLAAFFVGLIILISVISTLSRFWFVIAMGIFFLFMFSLKLELLSVAGMSNRIPGIVALVLLCGLAYYFQAVRTSANFLLRFSSFAVAFSAVFGTLIFLAETPDPLLFLSVNSFALSVIITLLFILMVAHEIPALFIAIITRGTTQTKSMQHVLVLFGFYLLNLFLAYGIKIGYINLEIWVIDFYLLLTISGLLGIWGFRQRESQYENIFTANPVGTYFLLGMAIISFATIALFLSTANDTVLIVIKDLIIYSHLGYGIIFLLYVIANFGSMLTRNLQVYKVLYKPATMPYFTFRIMGLICTFAFLVFDTNWRTPFNQVIASYYIGYGDLYLSQGDAEKAEVAYTQSLFFRKQNHHAHYALAGINAARLEPQNELEHWIEASGSFPPEHTIVNTVDAYRRSDKTAEALTLVDRYTSRNNSAGAILNAKGIIYSRLSMADSALQAFQQARKFGYTKTVAETNLLAASVKFKLNFPADSLLRLLDSDQEGPKSNALALANLQNKPIDIDFKIGEDTSLNATRAALLCNYIINQREKVDTATLANMTLLARQPSNEAFKEYLLYACAQAYYVQGRVRKAFELTREIAYGTGDGKYFLLLGNWALEQGNPEIAGNYYAIAKEKQMQGAEIYEALAHTEDSNFSDALQLWQVLSNDSLHATSANKIMKVLKANANMVTGFDDEEKYLYCRYKLSLTDSVLFKKIVNTIQSEELKARIVLDYSHKWYEKDETEIAAGFLDLLEGLEPAKETTLAQFYNFNCMLHADTKNWAELERLINTVDLLKKYYPNVVIYFQALIHEKNGATEKAKDLFNYLGNANMYFDEGVVAASSFLAAHGTDRLSTYTMLVEGLLVKPNSVKLLKAHIKEAAAIGFTKEAEESLNKLKKLISVSAFNQYIKGNPDFFSLE